ncbi:MAG: sugar phosphate isomerase/epimerase family protein [Clostridiales bacterium]|nr:sugar phosphate isomerase/epimerase family protein [Clostridiales bacterium]
MKEIKFGTCLAAFGSCGDRYCLSGYGVQRTLEELFYRVSQVKDIRGVELVNNWHVNERNYKSIKDITEKYKLEVCMITSDLWTQAKWGKGSFASKDKKIREDAIAEVKMSMDIAAELVCNKVDIWLGQDGFDYSFQTDYMEDWNNIVECTRECSNYRDDIKICIEYKLKEPRTHCYVNSAAKALLLVNEIQKENVGILLDVGHSIAALENPAEASALISRYKNKLFYIHLNDNYRYWDDDMMFGSVNMIVLMEFMYWLDVIGYDDYYTLDIFPYREDGIKAAVESIEWVKALKKLISRIGKEKIKEILTCGDATESMKMIRQAIIPSPG